MLQARTTPEDVAAFAEERKKNASPLRHVQETYAQRVRRLRRRRGGRVLDQTRRNVDFRRPQTSRRKRAVFAKKLLSN